MLERNQRIIFNPFPMKRRIKYVATTVGQIDKKDENILQVFQLSCILLFSDLHGSHSGVSGNGFLTLRTGMGIAQPFPKFLGTGMKTSIPNF